MFHKSPGATEMSPLSNFVTLRWVRYARKTSLSPATIYDGDLGEALSEFEHCADTAHVLVLEIHPRQVRHIITTFYMIRDNLSSFCLVGRHRDFK